MTNNDLVANIEAINLDGEFMPSKTYHVQNGRIIGCTDGINAIRQAVDKILQIERFIYPIYSENYGVELERFIGESFEFVKADLERTIEEALQSDDRIEGISDFELEQKGKSSLAATFTVNTIAGSFNETREIPI